MRRLLAALAVIATACSAPADQATIPAGGPSGNWSLVEGTVFGDLIPEGEFRITLVLQDGSVQGVAACNGYGGQYTSDPTSIRFGNTGTEMMACAEPAMTAQEMFLDGLARVDSYTLAGLRMTLDGPDVNLVFETIHPIETAAIFDQRWTLESLIDDGASSSAQGDGFLLLSSDGHLTGSTGCRTLGGVFITRADEIVPTEFGAQGNCPPDLGQQDSHFIAVIESGFSAFVKEDRLTLMDPDGTGLQFRAEG